MSATTTTTSEQARRDYDKAAEGYDGYGELPSGQLEAELIRTGLGDFTGCTVLDLGGGINRHARTALQLGATVVDLVDIPATMIQTGKASNDATRLRFWQADVAQPLDHLPLLPEGYEIVMADWIFSFAASTETLHGADHVYQHPTPSQTRRPFIGVRDADPWSLVLQTGKYGGLCRDLSLIPGGVRYVCVLRSTPPIEFVGTCLEVIYSGSTDVYEQFDLSEVVSLNKFVPTLGGQSTGCYHHPASCASSSFQLLCVQASCCSPLSLRRLHLGLSPTDDGGGDCGGRGIPLSHRA